VPRFTLDGEVACARVRSGTSGTSAARTARAGGQRVQRLRTCVFGLHNARGKKKEGDTFFLFQSKVDHYNSVTEARTLYYYQGQGNTANATFLSACCDHSKRTCSL